MSLTMMGPEPASRQTHITDTAVHVGEWAAIIALVDTAFTELISNSMSLNGATIPSGGQSHAGMTLGKGSMIRGIFTTITLASGAVVASTGPVWGGS